MSSALACHVVSVKHVKDKVVRLTWFGIGIESNDGIFGPAKVGCTNIVSVAIFVGLWVCSSCNGSKVPEEIHLQTK